jgi:hypothetical protein
MTLIEVKSMLSGREKGRFSFDWKHIGWYPSGCLLAWDEL